MAAAAAAGSPLSDAQNLDERDLRGEIDLEDDLPSNKRPPLNLDRAGTVRCLRCGKTFQSWNRTRNRLCRPCKSRQPWQVS